MISTVPSVVLAAAESGGVTVGPVRAAIVTGLIALGLFFLVVGTVGLIRLPNVYNRMHATTKSTTLGAGLIALAGVAYFGPGGDGLSALVTVAFLYITAPTGAHMISRAAQRMDIPFLEDTEWPDDESGPVAGGEAPGDDSPPGDGSPSTSDD